MNHFFRGLILAVVITIGNSAYAEEAMPKPPASPPPSEWKFVDALAEEVTWTTHWTRTKAKRSEVNLKNGVRIESTFPDKEGLLDTAYVDLNKFLKATGIASDGDYRIITEQVPTATFETFNIIVSKTECRIQANDTEGIRRGIYYLEDTLLGAEGPFLSLGKIERSPFIHTRISRCFFGPIKRAPKYKDELLDDVDYYPGDYLNRLAHDGVNALWLTIEFKDIGKTSLTSVVAPDRDKRIAKLRKTVAKCRRYGIQVFLFCIEPRVMSPDNPLLKDHPEIGSKPFRGSSFLFCPFSDASQRYLYEVMYDIFSETPNLGGLINISFGERSTTCLSGADKNWKIACPKCSSKKPGEILRSSLGAMERGMHAANAEAKFISWLYVPGNGTGVQRDVNTLIDIAHMTPPRVISQYNFESDGTKTQLGKERHAGDYWLSYVGPSEAFLNVAAGTASGDGELGAKLQACNSFEVSTVPYVPVPSNLYKKYREMRRLGVTSVMQCWYIGNMPSLMNRSAASLLPFSEKTLSEEEFLGQLARRDWGAKNADTVVKAWGLFSEAYDHYPMTNAFQYYGPMHDGIVWPLYLKPAHKNLSPVWKLEFPPSGDRIGECFSGTHTLDEVIKLCEALSNGWDQGLKRLTKLKPQYTNDPARLQDISVAEALGIQFRSGYNTLRFYSLREELLYGPEKKRAKILKQLRDIAEEEIELSEAMVELCELNPFLGFQAEAEGYTYSPDELRWRVERLRDMLRTEFAEAENAIDAGDNVFPAKSGLLAGDYNHLGQRVDDSFATHWESAEAWASVKKVPGSHKDLEWSWQATHDDTYLYINIDCAPSERWRAVEMKVAIQPSHIYPRRSFRASIYGKRDIRQTWLGPDMLWDYISPKVDGQQSFRMRIPFAGFQGEYDPTRPMRINFDVAYITAKKQQAVLTWVPRDPNRVKGRLGYGGDNPREMGWLRLE